MNRLLLSLVPLMLILSGCWDQRLLKETRLVYGVGFDLEDNMVKNTIVIRSVPGNPNAEYTNELISTKAETIRKARNQIDNKIAGQIGTDKVQVFLLGEDIINYDLYAFLDVFYRDPSSPLSAKIAVVKGKAHDILALEKKENTLISEYINELITIAEDSFVVPKQSVQKICTHMFDEGRDFALPLLVYDSENKGLDISGVALFNEKLFTGNTLNSDQSAVMLMLSGAKMKNAEFTYQVNDKDKENWLYNYVSYKVFSSNHQSKFYKDNLGTIHAEINITLDIGIDEYPLDHLNEDNKAKDLSQKIKERLTNDSKDVIQLLQDSNTDLFGLGRDLLAYHPDLLKDGKLEKGYFENMKITPNISIDIKDTGVIF